MLLQRAVGIPAVSARMPADSLPHLGGPVAPGPAPAWRLVGLILHGQPPRRRHLHRRTCAHGGRGCRKKKNLKPRKFKARPGWGEKCQEKQKTGRSGRAHVRQDPTTAAPLAQPHRDVARLRGRPLPSSGIARCSSALTAGSWEANAG